MIDALLDKGLGKAGIFDIKLGKVKVSSPVNAVRSLLNDVTGLQEPINDTIATAIDNLYFDAVISAESVKESNSATIEQLMDPGVSSLRLLLEYRANNNMLFGLLSESAQTESTAKLIPIRERITAVKSSMLKSVDSLKSLEHGAELVAGIDRIMVYADLDSGVLATRQRLLEERSSFENDMFEANKSLDQLVENVSWQVAAAKTAVSEASAQNHEMIQWSKKLLVGFATGSLILTALLLWLLVSRNILKRLSNALDALQKVSHGHLFDKVEVVGRDELAQLAMAVESFREKALENNKLIEAQAKAVLEQTKAVEERHRLEVESRQRLEEQNKLKLEQAERERIATMALRNDTDALLEVVTAASKGDLNKTITVKGSHPTGQLGSGLDQLISSFTEVMNQISSTANAVASGSDSIANSNMLLSERTQLQAASLEETAASMQSITAVVVNNSKNAEKAESLVNNAHQKTQEVGRVVQDTVVAMNKINESSKEISAIVDVIDEIAFQTNLLALNASVEAARAGQQGAGFAVVAEEVRVLAARSATAAREISALIDESVKKVDHGVQLADSSGSTLAELASSVECVINIIKEIVKDSKEQSEGIHTVNEATRILDEMTQKNLEMVDEGVAASDSLAAQASKLKRQVGFFTFKNEVTVPDHSRAA